MNMNEKTQLTDAQWRARLTPEQYAVLREKGTERAFTGAYTDEKAPGMYRCAGCGTELFRSDAKFDSGSGWPSFVEPASLESVETHVDTSHGIIRTEVTCAAAAATSVTSSRTARARRGSGTASTPAPSCWTKLPREAAVNRRIAASHDARIPRPASRRREGRARRGPSPRHRARTVGPRRIGRHLTGDVIARGLRYRRVRSEGGLCRCDGCSRAAGLVPRDALSLRLPRRSSLHPQVLLPRALPPTRHRTRHRSRQRRSPRPSRRRSSPSTSAPRRPRRRPPQPQRRRRARVRPARLRVPRRPAAPVVPQRRLLPPLPHGRRRRKARAPQRRRRFGPQR